jgi:glyoxylase-like metal-dependent hydrolase (beta-lactamase superfamily II)
VHSLGERPLDNLVKTHLHSDNWGGNAALQCRYPDIQTFIPPGHAPFVKDCDPLTLTFTPTEQFYPRFVSTGLLIPGLDLILGDQKWQIHGAPGYDPHTILLFEPQSRVVISADSLW